MPVSGHSPAFRPEKGDTVTDSSDRTEGDTADAPDSPEGTWRKRYDGLQRVLGQRTYDLEEARRIAQEATARAQSAEAAARDYQQLYDTLYVPPEPADEPPAPPTQADEDEPYVHANNPRRQTVATPEPQTSAEWFELLGKYPPESYAKE
jgi:hypothetical protein